LRAHSGYERELVPAYAGHEGSISRNLEPARDRAQKLIADNVAEYVIGLLELVEIDRQHGKGLAADLGALEGLRQA